VIQLGTTIEFPFTLLSTGKKRASESAGDKEMLPCFKASVIIDVREVDS
jgi:hypothetical protein